MKNKVNAKMIRRAVKILMKKGIKPDKDGFIEIEDPTLRTDFLYLHKIKRGKEETNENKIKL